MINAKNYWKWKRDCAWGCSRWSTLPEKIYRSQSTNQFDEWNKRFLVLCVLRIFSGGIYHLEQPHTITLGFCVKLTPFFDGKKNAVAVHLMTCFQFCDQLSDHFRWNEEWCFSNAKCDLIANSVRNEVGKFWARESAHSSLLILKPEGLSSNGFFFCPKAFGK